MSDVLFIIFTLGVVAVALALLAIAMEVRGLRRVIQQEAERPVEREA